MSEPDPSKSQRDRPDDSAADDDNDDCRPRQFPAVFRIAKAEYSDGLERR